MAVSIEELKKFRLQILNSPHVPVPVTTVTTTGDSINHPPHYTASGVEPIDVIEAWKLGFHLGNCLKYLARCELKGRPIEDLEKARWYLDREIERRKKAHA